MGQMLAVPPAKRGRETINWNEVKGRDEEPSNFLSDRIRITIFLDREL